VLDRHGAAIRAAGAAGVRHVMSFLRRRLLDRLQPSGASGRPGGPREAGEATEEADGVRVWGRREELGVDALYDGNRLWS
jgi:hypothetical protein